MSERKYTDEEIIKAYECCELNACSCSEGCPYRGTSGARKDEVCFLKARNDVYSLLNRQKADGDKLQEVNADLNESLRLAAEANKDLKAEIEELEYDRNLIFDEGKTWQKKANALQVELDAMRGAANSLKMHYEKAKAEAIKEFAERVKDKARMPIGTLYGKMVYVEDIDDLVAEMTEGE